MAKESFSIRSRLFCRMRSEKKIKEVLYLVCYVVRCGNKNYHKGRWKKAGGRGDIDLEKSWGNKLGGYSIKWGGAEEYGQR